MVCAFSSRHDPDTFSDSCLRGLSLIPQSLRSWGALILTALGVVLGTLLRQKERFSADVIPSFALCTNTSPDCYSYASNPNNSILFQKHIYETCGCMDFCSTYSPAAPMRRGSNMVALNTNYPNVSAIENFHVEYLSDKFGLCRSTTSTLMRSIWTLYHKN